jgi:hypothetical protein
MTAKPIQEQSGAEQTIVWCQLLLLLLLHRASRAR